MPNPIPWLLTRPDGTRLDLADLRGREACMLVLADRFLETVRAFAAHFQDQGRGFRQAGLRLVTVYKDPEQVPTPWPAPDWSPFTWRHDPPEGLEWGKAYLLDIDGQARIEYPELDLLSVNQVEREHDQLRKGKP